MTQFNSETDNNSNNETVNQGATTCRVRIKFEDETNDISGKNLYRIEISNEVINNHLFLETDGISAIREIREREDEFSYFRHLVNDKNINKLRRTIMTKVCTLAIDLVYFEINTTRIDDELLAHSLGLLPIVSDSVHLYTDVNKCDCEEYCSKCSYTLDLDVTGSENKKKITSSDLKLTSQNVNHKFVSDITICRITTGQRIKLSAVVKRGNGSIHTKWSPLVAFSWNKYIKSIDMKENNNVDNFKSDYNKSDSPDSTPPWSLNITSNLTNPEISQSPISITSISTSNSENSLINSDSPKNNLDVSTFGIFQGKYQNDTLIYVETDGSLTLRQILAQIGSYNLF